MPCNKQKITAYTRLYNGVAFSWNQFRDSSPFRVFFPTQLHSNKFNLILIIKHNANTLLWIHFHELRSFFPAPGFRLKPGSQSEWKNVQAKIWKCGLSLWPHEFLFIICYWIKQTFVYIFCSPPISESLSVYNIWCVRIWAVVRFELNALEFIRL